MNWAPSKPTKYGPTWDSDCGNYRIAMAANGFHRLISFVDEDEDGEFRWWDFNTLAEAKAYAEKL